MLKISKYHASDASYLIVLKKDLANIDIKNLAIHSCNIATGLGASGLIVVDDDFKIDVYSLDGIKLHNVSGAVICFVKYIYDENMLKLDTPSNDLEIIVNGKFFLCKIQCVFPFIVQVEYDSKDESRDDYLNWPSTIEDTFRNFQSNHEENEMALELKTGTVTIKNEENKTIITCNVTRIIKGE